MKRLVLLMASAALVATAQEDPQQRMLQWMDGIAQQQLTQRAAEIGKIRSTDEARRRQEYVRSKVVELLGGLPDYNGPLNAKLFKTLVHDEYTIEKVVFESLPQVWVTANVYVPKQVGRNPAVLLPLGHWDEGKVGPQQIAANLAMKGFVVLVYDPWGQGERLQAYDPRTGRSLAGGSTDQHFMAGAQSLLIGESFAKYRIWDGKRALDYLVSRPDVDADRIGCTGCSGGGTLATFISALDPRVKVAAPACYMNSYRVLFTGSIGDSEQSLPNFLSSGLDQTDLAELFAPKPWLISSTVDDFFKLEGARQVYEEARAWYRIYGSEDKINWAIGPGGHGTPKQIREAIYAWFIRWLKDGKGDSTDRPIQAHTEIELRATATGQVSTSLKSRDIYEVIRDGYNARKRPGSPEQMQEVLRGISAPVAEPAPAVKVVNETLGPDLITRQVAFESERGVAIGGTLLIPRKPGRQPGVLVVERSGGVSALSQEIAAQGSVVFALTPRDLPYGSSRVRPGAPSEYPMLGDWIGATRAWLIGRNLPGMWALDIRRGIDVLSAQPEVDPSNIRGAAREVAGIWLLMAAATDPRIKALWLDRTPASFRSAFDNPLNTNLHEAVIPGFALRWDLQDMVRAIAPRKVVWTDPTDWMRNVVELKTPYLYRPFEGGDEPYIQQLMK